MDMSPDPTTQPTLREILIHQHYMARMIDEGVSGVKELNTKYDGLESRVEKIEQTHDTIKKIVLFGGSKLSLVVVPLSLAAAALIKFLGVV